VPAYVNSKHFANDSSSVILIYILCVFYLYIGCQKGWTGVLVAQHIINPDFVTKTVLQFSVREKTLGPGCIKRCKVVVKVNITSSDLIGGYLIFYLNQPIKWADFRLDALLADTMLTKLYTTWAQRVKTKMAATQ
jgi:hypothetical protein